nr:heme exporter protein CcmD [Rhizobium halophytocola]
MDHAFYIYTAYIVTFVLIGALIGWTLLDGHFRKRELKVLEVSGIRRRSARPKREGDAP